jgi:hypothetical protein
MAFCNVVGKVSNWNAGGVPLADMLLLLWWTMHFVLWEWDGMSHSRCLVSKICILFGYEFQHIPFKWMHHTYCHIVRHLNIDSALFTLQSYVQFFLHKALISIWMQSLSSHHWLCVITSWTSLQHIWTAPANTWYHYLLSCFQARIVFIMEKERCHGCDKWFAWIEQHLTYHKHCRSVMVEHAHQQRLVVECPNRNNGMDPS